MNPNRAAPTIPPAHNTMNARNTSAIFLINGSPLLVFPSPSIIGMMSRFARISRPEWDKRKNRSCEAPQGGVCAEGWRQPIGVSLQPARSLFRMELIGYPSAVSEFGSYRTCAYNQGFQITRIGDSSPTRLKRICVSMRQFLIHWLTLPSKRSAELGQLAPFPWTYPISCPPL